MKDSTLSASGDSLNAMPNLMAAMAAAWADCPLASMASAALPMPRMPQTALMRSR